MPGPVVHLHDYAGPSYDGIPTIGQHTDEVLEQWLGLDQAARDELVAAGVVGRG